MLIDVIFDFAVWYLLRPAVYEFQIVHPRAT